MPLAFQPWAWPGSGVLRRLVAAWFDFKEWFLIDLNRSVLALALAVVGFGFFLWLELAGVVDVERSTTPMLYLFSALAGGNITLITIVVSINQLILSRELRSPRELETEMHAAEEFRDEVEAETEALVVPEEPAEFLRVLVTDTRGRVERLDDAVGDVDDAALTVDLDNLVTTLAAELDETARRLEQSERGVFPALSTILDVDFATRINHTRWIARAYEASLPDRVRETLEELEQHLEQLDVARQYFKTIYIKQELADLSKLVMSTGMVAVLVAIVFIVLTGYRTTVLPFWGHTLLVPIGVLINLVPLTLLISHVLRISAVARRTAAITPFLAPTE